VAANVSAGAQFGFLLLWVIVAANVMAGLVQYLSAKPGLVTGRSLPEAIGARMSRPARLAYWAQAEIVAMATDVAEVIGGAVALGILFHPPLPAGGVITGVVSLLLLADPGSPRSAVVVRDTVSPAIAVLFAIGLLASGLASTSVGAHAGAMIMQGLLYRSVPMLVRRLVALTPALAILACGANPTRTLVLSQVVLSFGIPLALLPLVALTGDRTLMGPDVNHRVTTAVGWLGGVMISLLNVVLIFLTVTD
jgi:Mn2+/Fe2+ NRAMP family transporter